MQENIPEDWVGKRAVVQYKSYSYGEGPWQADLVEGVISEKNDVGVIVSPKLSTRDSPRTQRLIAYDAILSVDVAM